MTRKELQDIADTYGLYTEEDVENRVKEFEKENAELKIKVTALEDANRVFIKELDNMISGSINILQNIVRNKEQFAHAKEIIKNLIDDLIAIDGEEIRELKAVKEAE